VEKNRESPNQSCIGSGIFFAFFLRYRMKTPKVLGKGLSALLTGLNDIATTTNGEERMEIIGEDLHVMNQEFLHAMENMDKEKILTLVKKQVDGGAMALDVNLGQNHTLGRLTPWLVETIQNEVNLPLLLSNHVLKQQRALEVHQGTATINAVTANSAELITAMKTALYFQANLVVLLVSSKLTPTDVNGRLQLANEVLQTASRVDFPVERLYLDPVISCRQDPGAWSLSAGLPDINLILESITFIGELGEPKLKTIVSLSNASVCLAAGERSSFHCKLLPLLENAGLKAVILNCRDKNLMNVANDLNLAHVA
jgi:5-methyltetrahydrofolate corrinoid/iron sulfur protein methyltransferase